MPQITNQHDRIRKITVAAMLTAITWLMTLTPYFGFTLPFFGVGMTFVHIPLIIGLLSEGLGVGMVLSGMFGLTSLFNALTRPTSIYSYMFQNPLVSVLPRLLIAPVIYLIHKLLKHLFPKHEKLHFIIVAAFAALTNTALTLSALSISHMLNPLSPVVQKSVEIIGAVPNAVIQMASIPAMVDKTLSTSIAAIWALAANVPFEIASAIIITVPVMTALRKIMK